MRNIYSNDAISSEVQSIRISDYLYTSCALDILREDRVHSIVSGNKFRKLKYNLKAVLDGNFSSLLSFGGAYSNHIAAVAALGKEFKLETIGVIRGEELGSHHELNPSLHFAEQCGMKLYFVSREVYRQKSEPAFIEELVARFGKFYMLPEGGTNELAIKGCEEILTSDHNDYDYICVSVGTGGTIAGLINASRPNQKVIGFSALKGNFQIADIKKYTTKSNYEILDSYCFGGYAKVNSDLIRFMNEFYSKTGILLDPVYTGKMMFGIIELLKAGYFSENSRILAVHTGGIQGITGMNEKLKKNNLPQIIV